MIKRFLTVMMVLCLASASLCGCGSKDDKGITSSAVSSQVSAPTPTPQPEKTAKAVKISADGGLNIRATPSTDGEIVGLAENGSMLPLLIENPSNGWYEVQYSGESAYVFAEYASVVDVTLEEYNKLKAGEIVDSAVSSATPESSVSSASSSSADDTTAVASTASSASSSTGAITNEDGE